LPRSAGLLKTEKVQVLAISARIRPGPNGDVAVQPNKVLHRSGASRAHFGSATEMRPVFGHVIKGVDHGPRREPHVHYSRSLGSRPVLGGWILIAALPGHAEGGWPVGHGGGGHR
jgi:hypothetical protein